MPENIVELEDFVRIPLMLFGAIGVPIISWPADERRGGWRLQHQISLIFFIFIVVLNIPFMLLFLVYGELVTTQDFTALAVYWVFMTNSIAKLISVIVARAYVQRVYKLLAGCFPETAQQRQDYRLDAHFAQIHRCNKYLTIYHFATTTMFNMFPVMESLLEHFMRRGGVGDFAYRLPFMMWYPIDIRWPLRYAFFYFFQCLGAYCCSCMFLGSDLLLISSVHLINMHLRVVTRFIEDYVPRGDATDEQALIAVLSYHKATLKYCDLINEAFSISILLNYFASCILICLIGLQVAVGTSFLDLIKFVAFLISMLVHIYFISVYSTELISLSEGISDAFSHSNWHLANIRYQRMLRLPIARAQRPARLTAYKFFVISMESFKTLMTMAYQAFTLLKTRMDQVE